MKNSNVKLQNNDELKKNYCWVLNEYESQGIIERVDHIAEPGGVLYLPHHAIVKNKKETSKIRIVFDGSSYLKNELSINEFLEPSPCFLLLSLWCASKISLGKHRNNSRHKTGIFANFSGSESLWLFTIFMVKFW